jgi:hypothetical protein
MSEPDEDFKRFTHSAALTFKGPDALPSFRTMSST